MANFDEKSGIVACLTDWGRWYQTASEVVIEANLEAGTRAKEAKIIILPNQISCTVRQNELFKGKPYDLIKEDESTWTIEDQKLLRIQLVKAYAKTKDVAWRSLMSDGQFAPDSVTLNEMRKKLDLEQFQNENPGFDFRNAKLDKRYEDISIKRLQEGKE